MKRILLPLLALLAGCYTHREYERNAPGHIDVLAPPAERAELPRDSGRQGVVLSGGLLGGGGFEFGRADGNRAGAALSLELSAQYYALTTSLEDTDQLPPLTGVNLGYTAFGSRLTQRTLYAELQRSADLLGAAAGWTWQPETNANGPQVTLFYGPVFVRSGYVLGRGGEVYFGLVLKAYEKLSWYR
jgi:hypothetical protein